MKDSLLDALLWGITFLFIVVVSWHCDTQLAKNRKHQLELCEALQAHLIESGLPVPDMLIIMLSELRVHVKMDSEKWYDVFRRRKATK